MNIADLLNQIDSIVWGPALLTLLVGTGLYLTIKLKGLQFRYLWYALKLAFTRNDDSAQGDISHFQALMTALAATIGIGSIAGVATAVAIGGVGSIFWMWVTALVGMATKYSEAILAVKYRIIDEKGQMAGGPMFFIDKGLGWKWMAVLFAIFGSIAAIGTGNFVQSHTVADALVSLYPFNKWWIGVVMAAFTGIVLLGGIKSIGKVSCVLVPVMALFYIFGGLLILGIEYAAIPAAMKHIVISAFTGEAALGGFAGSTIMMAFQLGVSRGVFSNEAGLGTASIAAAAAKTDNPGRQALISMTGTFLDTIVVCSITGLVLAVTHVLGATNAQGEMLNGAPLTIEAFNSVLPGSGIVVTIGVILFAYTTIIGWAYYGEKCCEYMFGCKSIGFYRSFYTLCVLFGSVLSMDIVWSIADIFNGLMAVPNLIGLLLLSKVIVSETKSFEATVEREKGWIYGLISKLLPGRN